jgi:hypothetical protein
LDICSPEINNSPSSWFQAVCNSFTDACQAAGEKIDRYFQIGRSVIRLQFAGPALIPHITPALAHLPANQTANPDLTVFLWDSATTGITLADIPFETGGQYVPGEIWSYSDDTLMIIYQPAHNTLNMLDKRTNKAVYWVRDASQVPYHDRGSPLRMILQRWMRHRGYLLVHGAAVGLPGRGVLLTGKGGCGKSTTALACLPSELLYAGDDYCLISGLQGPHVYSIYNTGKQNASDVGRFPELLPALSNANALDKEKALYFFHDFLPEKMSSEFPVAAILIPQITGRQETRLTPVSPAKALLALAPSTVYQLHAAEQQQIIRSLSDFIRMVPNYRLELGSDISQIPRVILDFLCKNRSRL